MSKYATVSLGTVFAKLYRDYRLNVSNMRYDMVEWSAEAIEALGVTQQYAKKSKFLIIEGYQRAIPSSLHEIRQMEFKGNALKFGQDNSIYEIGSLGRDTTAYPNVTNSRTGIYSIASVADGGSSTLELTLSGTNTVAVGDSLIVDGTTSYDGLHTVTVVAGSVITIAGTFVATETGSATVWVTQVSDSSDTYEFYTLKPGYIVTSFETGVVKMHYDAIPLDSNNLPMIIDNHYVKTAVVNYIVMMMMLGGWQHPTIDFNRAEQRWLESLVTAQNHVMFPNPDKFESFKNAWVRLIPRFNLHDDFFMGYADQENVGV